MEHWFAERSVGAMLPGDHAWLSYASREEQEHVIGAFLRDGLTTDDKVVYITDDDPYELPGLRTRYGIDPVPHLRTGRLTVLRRADFCLTDGAFDPGRMIASLRDILAGAERDRFRGVRVTADMTWAIHQRNGRDRLLACEAGLDAAIAPSTTAMAICQIDRRRCTGDELTVLKQTHEVLVGADPDFDDGVLTITRTFSPRGLRLRGELDGARHLVFAEALRTVLEPGGDVHIDLADLRFIDLGALRTMAGVAMELGGRGGLVLTRPSPDVAHVVRLLGGRALPGLRIEDGDGS